MSLSNVFEPYIDLAQIHKIRSIKQDTPDHKQYNSRSIKQYNSRSIKQYNSRSIRQYIPDQSNNTTPVTRFNEYQVEVVEPRTTV